MKRIIATALLLLASTVADAWCLPGYTEAQDLCHPGLVYCLAAGQTAPTTCGQQQQQQQQNQSQGQGQSQSSNNTNVNNNTSSSHSSSASASTSNATGGSSTSNAAGGAGGAGGNGGSANASGGQGGTGFGGTGTGGTSGVTSSGNQTGAGGGASVVVQGDNVQAQARNPVNTAFAAPTLVVQTDSCRTGFGVGGQAVAFGFTMSGTARDENCEVIKLARELTIYGYKPVAVELLRGDERVEAAFKRLEKGRNTVGYIEQGDKYVAKTLVYSDHGK